MADWQAAWAALRELDGNAWDAESERLNTMWKAEYRGAFIAHALSRPGWNREHAEVWAGEIVDDALIDRRGDPAETARVDVLECERESE